VIIGAVSLKVPPISLCFSIYTQYFNRKIPMPRVKGMGISSFIVKIGNELFLVFSLLQEFTYRDVRLFLGKLVVVLFLLDIGTAAARTVFFLSFCVLLALFCPWLPYGLFMCGTEAETHPAL